MYKEELHIIRESETPTEKPLSKSYIDAAFDIIINYQMTGVKLQTSEKMFLQPLYKKLEDLTK